eukprot:1878210-Amphidinium_carterae.1
MLSTHAGLDPGLLLQFARCGRPLARNAPPHTGHGPKALPMLSYEGFQLSLIHISEPTRPRLI